MIRVLYFAWLRQRTGLAAEEVEPPPEVATIGALMRWLATRSPGHAAAFTQPKVCWWGKSAGPEISSTPAILPSGRWSGIAAQYRF